MCASCAEGRYNHAFVPISADWSYMCKVKRAIRSGTVLHDTGMGCARGIGATKLVRWWGNLSTRKEMRMCQKRLSLSLWTLKVSSPGTCSSLGRQGSKGSKGIYDPTRPLRPVSTKPFFVTCVKRKTGVRKKIWLSGHRPFATRPADTVSFISPDRRLIVHSRQHPSEKTDGGQFGWVDTGHIGTDTGASWDSERTMDIAWSWRK